MMGPRERPKDWQLGSLQMQVLLVAFFSSLTVFTLLMFCLGPLRSHPAGDLKRPGGVKKSHIYDISNETLLAIATKDPAAEKEKIQIKDLLEMDVRSAWMRQHGEKRDRERDRNRERRRLPLGGGWRGVGSEMRPIQLSSPQYLPYWPTFRLLLHSWGVIKASYDPKVMQSLLASIKEPIDRHYQQAAGRGSVSPPKKYATCAVVGNSGILLNRVYGATIDGHEMVLRLNNARTAGFERHVGAKTTIAFMNSNILHVCARRVRCFCHPYGDGVPIVMYISQVRHLMDVAMCAPPTHHAPLIVTDRRFDSLVTRIVKWYSVREYVEQTGKSVTDWAASHDGDFHYSSGMQAVLLALGICEEVDLFGFGKSNSTKHHYHTAQRQELKLHDYEAEYTFYDDLINMQLASIPFLGESDILIPPVRVFE